MHRSIRSINIPRATPGHLNFWWLVCSNSAPWGKNCVQMPCPSAGLDGQFFGKTLRQNQQLWLPIHLPSFGNYTLQTKSWRLFQFKFFTPARQCSNSPPPGHGRRSNARGSRDNSFLKTRTKSYLKTPVKVNASKSCQCGWDIYLPVHSLVSQTLWKGNLSLLSTIW